MLGNDLGHYIAKVREENSGKLKVKMQDCIDQY